jgi:hypothetical protein
MGQVGTMVNAGTWRGRTLSKSLRLMVAMVATPSRSATATSEASVPPSRRSAYWRTSSDIRRRSASVRFTGGIGVRAHCQPSRGTVPRRSDHRTVDEVARLGQDGDRQGELVGLFFQPAAAEFMCRVGPIRQRHNDVGVHQNHDERSATEAVREQLVHPLG